MKCVTPPIRGSSLAGKCVRGDRGRVRGEPQYNNRWCDESGLRHHRIADYGPVTLFFVSSCLRGSFYESFQRIEKVRPVNVLTSSDVPSVSIVTAPSWSVRKIAAPMSR